MTVQKSHVKTCKNPVCKNHRIKYGVEVWNGFYGSMLVLEAAVRCALFRPVIERNTFMQFHSKDNRLTKSKGK